MDVALRGFLISAAYSNTIGLLAWMVMPRIGAHLQSRSRLTTWTILLSALVAIGIVGTCLAFFPMYLAGWYGRGTWQQTLWPSMKIALGITLAFGTVATIVETLRGRLNETALQLRTKELERERALKVASEARLSSLESRIHPHFLFNALNSISSLIREDPDKAEQLVERFSRLLRSALDSNMTGLIAIEREMKIVADYLEIERTRFGDRLRYSIHVAPDARAVEVPPLSIQTLVENAVKYSIAPRREGGEIRVDVSMRPEGIRVAVWDDGPGFDLDSLPSGHGLDLLRGRLHSLFGDRAGLEFLKVDDGMTVAIRQPA